MEKNGNGWKYKDDDKPVRNLITKFEIIKNLPQGFLSGINHKKYYPGISYEDDEMPYFETNEFVNELDANEKGLNKASLNS